MSTIRPTRIVALIVALLLVTAACSSGDDGAVITSGNNPVTAPRDLVDTAVAAEFTTLVAALQATELDVALREEGPFTVFAPTDAAFAALPDGLVTLLLEPENLDLLADILSFHVAEGLNLSTALLEASEIATLEGSDLTIAIVEEPATDADAEPTTTVEIGGVATLATPDQLATNGVIHVIDTVLVPDDRADDLDALIDEIPESTDIMSTLDAEGDFGILLSSLDAAGLTDTLSGDGAFTLFAPTDDAFEALTADQLALLESDPDLLESVLLAHVLGRTVRTSDVLTEQYVTSLGGQGARFARVITRTPLPLDDDAEEGAEPEVEVTITFTFGGVELRVTDIEATNGVIHVIDTVIVPDSARGPGGL